MAHRLICAEPTPQKSPDRQGGGSFLSFLRTPTPSLTVGALCLVLSACSKPPALKDGGSLKVVVNGHAFDTQLNLSFESRNKGMGGRKTIPEDFAMLFAYPEPKVANFVMRDCHFPIAVIFLDDRGRVIKTHLMPIEKPGTVDDDLIRYSSETSMQFALEVRGDQLEKLGVVPGKTVVELPLEKLGKAAE